MTDAELVHHLKHQLYSLNVFCGGCRHSRFVHGDADEHSCFFNECSCAAWISEPAGDEPPGRPLHVA